MMVFRGSNFAGPSSRTESTDREGDTDFVQDVSSFQNLITTNGIDVSSVSTNSKPIVTDPDESMTEEEAEFNNLLDGLGPSWYDDWWGTGILPVPIDAD